VRNRRVIVLRMTPDEFRSLAISFPEAEEREHMGHPDFRVGGKIFATLGSDDQWGMVKLTLDQQAEFMQRDPKTFEPIPGGWGLKGATKVMLSKAKTSAVRLALATAWRNTAPKRLLRQFEQEG
jgi:hypothetical protein